MSQDALNPQQFQDLYHNTSPENAAQIKTSGKWKSKENTGDVYFTTHPHSEYAEGFGQAQVHVKVPEGVGQLNDEFPSGEQHLAIPGRSLNKSHYVGTRILP